MPDMLSSVTVSAGARARAPQDIACYGCYARREEALAPGEARQRTHPCEAAHRKLLDAVAHGLLLGVKQGGQRLDKRLRRDHLWSKCAATGQTRVRTDNTGREYSRTGCARNQAVARQIARGRPERLVEDVQRRHHHLEHLVAKGFDDVLLRRARAASERRGAARGALARQRSRRLGPSCYAVAAQGRARTTTASACSSSTSAMLASAYFFTVPGRCFRPLLAIAAQKGGANLRQCKSAPQRSPRSPLGGPACAGVSRAACRDPPRRCGLPRAAQVAQHSVEPLVQGCRVRVAGRLQQQRPCAHRARPSAWPPAGRRAGVHVCGVAPKSASAGSSSPAARSHTALMSAYASARTFQFLCATRSLNGSFAANCSSWSSSAMLWRGGALCSAPVLLFHAHGSVVL